MGERGKVKERWSVKGKGMFASQSILVQLFLLIPRSKRGKIISQSKKEEKKLRLERRENGMDMMRIEMEEEKIPWAVKMT